jgi:hypothetical protein
MGVVQLYIFLNYVHLILSSNILYSYFKKNHYFTDNNSAQRLKEGFRDERRAQIMVTLRITLLYVEVKFLDLNEIGERRQI